jgi:hypothetical protein
LIKDINKREHVQKFVLRVYTKELSMSYEDLLAKSHVPDPELTTRRDHLSLGLLQKVINGECILPNAPLSTYTTTYSTRSNETNRYVLPFARTNLLQGSYFHRAISLWNSLPASVTNTTSLPSFTFIKLILFVRHLCHNNNYYYHYFHGYIHRTSVFCTNLCVLCILMHKLS